MAQTTKLTDFPSDILYNIFPYLSAADYLRLTNSTRALFPYREDQTFWHALTRKTFRIPDQPLLQGARWQWLYKKLLTQTRLYTWGNNKSGNLGITQRVLRKTGWPEEVAIEVEVGIVADVQCGGWSTTILNSIGAIYLFGILDRQRFIHRDSSLRRLDFPPAYPPTTNARYEPSTAIKQYSTGRASVLGLADDGKVWMWESDMGFQVKPIHVDLVENKVKSVVAGWDRNSMYVNDVGILYWTSVQDSDVIRGGRREALAVADKILVDSVTIPGTGYHRKKTDRHVEDCLESRVGEVISYVVLAEYIVFTTDLNKVFCYPTVFPVPALDIPEPIELTTFYTASQSESFKIRDLQGSFTRFAIFTHSGSVLTASHDLLHAFRNASTSLSHDTPESLPSPALVPSLQSQAIISLAFGDHHFHALHINGEITSYGQEPQRCGALGLGSPGRSELRGVRCDRPSWDNGYLPDGEGRTVWFEPLMDIWLHDMQRKSTVESEGNEGGVMLHAGHAGVQEAYANYFEREGAKWEESVTKEEEMGAFFVLKIAAAGWHSAALVLVDDDKAEKARQSHTIRPSPTRPPPSPALSAQSTDSYEVIESPGEQLANTVYAIYAWLWEMGRIFLGLTARDAAREAEERGKEREEEVDEVEYTWSKETFPRLRLSDGKVTPGTRLSTE